MDVRIVGNYAELSSAAADIVMATVAQKPDCVLTLPSGGTPLGMYEKLVEAYNGGRVDFSKVTLFDLDTYAFLEDSDPRSNYSYLTGHFTGKVNVNPARWFRLDGAGQNAQARAARYEQEILSAGGLDLAVIGIGHNGHIAYNEPGSSFSSRTRLVELAGTTKSANSRWVSTPGDVPAWGLTMGIATIMSARRILLLASGEGKANIVARAIKGQVSEDVPATALRNHENSCFLLDEKAASAL